MRKNFTLSILFLLEMILSAAFAGNSLKTDSTQDKDYLYENEN